MTMLGYKIIGEGEKKVIILHELMGDHRNYDSSVFYFDKKNFSYIFIDLRGYGLSKNIKGEYSCDEASNDVKNLLLKLDIKEYFLVAHSMSTMIAQKIALIDKRVKKLLLITPISAAGIKMKESAKNKLLEEMQENRGKIEEIVNSSSKRYNQTWRDYRIKLAYESSTLEARVGYMKMYLNTDFLEEAYENIDIPIKIIIGDYDFPVFSMNQVKKSFSKYKDVQIEECKESGHYAMLETPVLFASKLETLLKS
ncbi:alpha/beta fold hydrolase [Halarcobacter anaerophilus]|uniref:Alpha/beta hydrolase n=1 Tax=Halarcobacter anaerophilus TaxID=877500 RepID=A0A4Q0Y173_9BACT|nr:alpha/beta hydrolase [Halarcobacter anaerophilus]QDF29901.1 alpha/beta hydrolase family protein [Halarcobacter anaerophilus]RXJ62864.1 alpha/beta hydrolase [Halarcobacter anaerophilus]